MIYQNKCHKLKIKVVIKLLAKELSYKAAYSCWEDIINNLYDAGCDEAIIKQCLQDLLDDKKQDIISCLYEHRNDLLQQLHQKQKQLDCLDFLIYKLEKCQDRKELKR